MDKGGFRPRTASAKVLVVASVHYECERWLPQLMVDA
jgi:hypothetical protein